MITLFLILTVAADYPPMEVIDSCHVLDQLIKVAMDKDIPQVSCSEMCCYLQSVGVVCCVTCVIYLFHRYIL